MSVFHFGKSGWKYYPKTSKHCEDYFNDLACACDSCVSYQQRRAYMFNLMAEHSTYIADPDVFNHHIRCRCDGCKDVADKLIKFQKEVKEKEAAAKEEAKPPPKRRKTPENPSPVPVPAPTLPTVTPRTESTDSSLSVPTTPQQSSATAVNPSTYVPESSNAMETEQGAHSTDCNCTDCLQTLLQEATAISENIPATQPKKPPPKFQLSQTDHELSYASVAAMAAKPGMPHHAWNKRCPEHLKRIAAMKNTSSPNQKKPAPIQPPKDQSTPRQRRPRQPATAPTPAPATAPNKDQQLPATSPHKDQHQPATALAKLGIEQAPQDHGTRNEKSKVNKVVIN
ncbi:uncharacterized protein [Palaemon carinicauda]|uniref:uncharacterized protein n=1 Tax=Palaemon carinicauda TaxID=392227 RepID=UPI0035B64320